MTDSANTAPSERHWQRFWIPRGQSITVPKDNYLPDPSSPLGAALNPSLASLDDYSTTPCLILLGEPGSGKTRAIQQAHSLTEAAAPSQDEILLFAFRDYGSEVTLDRYVFGSAEFQRWASGLHRLTLFLDALDEGLLPIPNLVQRLLHGFTRSDRARLSVRITCRTAVLPHSLEHGLQELWGKENVTVLELAPLRESDIRVAALDWGLPDVDDFLRQVAHHRLTSLAMMPLSLQFLVATYKRAGTLPLSRHDLYRRGLLALCDEPNQLRRDLHTTGFLTPNQRLAVASRLAGITMFSNRTAFWTGADLGTIPDTDVALTSLVGSAEGLDASATDVTIDVLRETIGTALFSTGGLNRTVWTHQTYPEYLAALFIYTHDMPTAQVLSIISVVTDDQRRIAPQLQEVTSWLATMRKDILSEVLALDPVVLLQSDAPLTMAHRTMLVRSLLDASQRGELPRHLRHWNKSAYERLKHPDLEGQLMMVFNSAASQEDTLQISLEIVASCRLSPLSTHARDIALDRSRSHGLRLTAARTLAAFIADTAVDVRKLLTLPSAEDPDDQLRAIALDTLWPTYLTIQELVVSLTPPQQGLGFLGLYQVFLGNLSARLTDNDLMHVLAWLSAQPDFQEGFRPLIDELLERTWPLISDAKDIATYACVLRRQLENEALFIGISEFQLFREHLESRPFQRQLLIKALIHQLETPEGVVGFFITDERRRMLRPDDIFWILQQLRESGGRANIEHAYATLVKFLIDWEDSAVLDALVSASEHTPVLYDVLRPFLEPIELDSKTARELRKLHNDYQEMLARRNRPPPTLEPSPAVRIDDCLAQSEAGALEAWIDLDRSLTLAVNSIRYGDIDIDPRTSPGWTGAADELRARILNAAYRFLELAPREAGITGQGQPLSIHEVFAYRALWLLKSEAPATLAKLSKDRWADWTRAVVRFSFWNSEGAKAHAQLLQTAYTIAPDAVIENLLILLSEDEVAHRFVSAIEHLGSLRDSRLDHALLTTLRTSALSPSATGRALRPLLQHDHSEAREYALVLLQDANSPDATKHALAQTAAQELLLNTASASWDDVWPALESSPDFARDVLISIAPDPPVTDEGFHTRLSEKQLGVLFMWLAFHYPYEQDNRETRVRVVGDADEMARWRDAVLRNLLQRGTPAAVNTLKSVSRDLPTLPWLKSALEEAKRHTSRQIWQPIEPNYLLAIASRAELRFVGTGVELLEVIIESLDRLQQDLSGETPGAEYLWNELNATTFRPKAESALSNFIKRHLVRDLQERGIITNREVEIRDTLGPARGSRTDIQVDAISKDQRDGRIGRITGILEVKGSWNRELIRGVESQLANNYLRPEHNAEHGIYVVGWYQCTHWDTADTRWKASKRHGTREEVTAKLVQECARLSTGGRLIKCYILDVTLGT